MLTYIIDWIKLNRLKVVVILFVAAAITLLQVDNTIKINALLTEIQQQNNQIREIKTNNQLLESKTIQLESAERITKIAREQLGMTEPNSMPVVIEKQVQD